MTGRMSREKGYRAEAAAVAWLRSNGFPHCQRQSAGAAGADIADLGPGLELEVKNRAKWDLGAWLDQLAAVMDRNDADMGAVIVKRAGTTDVGQWWFCQPSDLLGLLFDETGWVECGCNFGGFRITKLADRYLDMEATASTRAVPYVEFDRNHPLDGSYSITTVEHGVRLLRAAGYGTPLPTEGTP